MKTLQSIKLGSSLLLLAACAFLMACGDEQDPRLSNADVACVKQLQAGYTTCTTGSASVTVTTTATATSTVTVTSTTSST